MTTKKNLSNKTKATTKPTVPVRDKKQIFSEEQKSEQKTEEQKPKLQEEQIEEQTEEHLEVLEQDREDVGEKPSLEEIHERLLKKWGTFYIVKLQSYRLRKKLSREKSIELLNIWFEKQI